jgi:hypothetical protein
VLSDMLISSRLMTLLQFIGCPIDIIAASIDSGGHSLRYEGESPSVARCLLCLPFCLPTTRLPPHQRTQRNSLRHGYVMWQCCCLLLLLLLFSMSDYGIAFPFLCTKSAPLGTEGRVFVCSCRSGGPGSIPVTTRKKSSGSGTGCTQPREYN